MDQPIDNAKDRNRIYEMSNSQCLVKKVFSYGGQRAPICIRLDSEKEGLEEDDRVGQEMDEVEELLFPWRGPSVGCSRILDVTNSELAGTASNNSYCLV